MNELKLELPSVDEIRATFYMPRTGGCDMPWLAVARLAQDSARKQIAGWLREMWQVRVAECSYEQAAAFRDAANALDPPAPAEKKWDEATLACVCDWMRQSMGEDHAKRFRDRFGLTKQEPSA